jgi:hypothetical protein
MLFVTIFMRAVLADPHQVPQNLEASKCESNQGLFDFRWIYFNMQL